MSQRIVLVGHCGVDAPRLEREICRTIKGAQVVTINSEQELNDVVEDEKNVLLLVNRQLPYGFEVEEGVGLMKDLHSRHPKLKMMLVSDLPDAQEQARQVGAVPGFGKAEIGTGKIAEHLIKILQGQQPA
jgi:response regulator of citrate/malate metabolism